MELCSLALLINSIVRFNLDILPVQFFLFLSTPLVCQLIGRLVFSGTFLIVVPKLQRPLSKRTDVSFTRENALFDVCAMSVD